MAMNPVFNPRNYPAGAPNEGPQEAVPLHSNPLYSASSGPVPLAVNVMYESAGDSGAYDTTSSQRRTMSDAQPQQTRSQSGSQVYYSSVA